MLPVMLEKSGRNSALTLPGPDHMMRMHHMAKRSLPSPLLMRKLFAYSPSTGELEWLERDPEMFDDGPRSAEWRARNWNAKHAGRIAFTSYDGHGYKTGAIFGQLYKAHHVIWAFMTGEWPVGDIDHINGFRADNRWHNLRQVSRSVNLRNAKRKSSNVSGQNGVHWRKDAQKWRAEITLNGVSVTLGLFADFDEACAARKAAEAGHGFTDRHGTA